MPDEHDDDQISKLLRLKRYEQPPPEFFENFLHEFHRRQRADVLREPLWRIAWERVTAFFGEQQIGRYAYSAATAVVLLAGTVISINILNAPSSPRREIAAAGPRIGQPAQEQSAAGKFDLDARVRLPDMNELSSRLKAQSSFASARPRYVMDTRPVSYEPASSF